MIRQIYRLTKPRQIEVYHAETDFADGEVLVKPEYMAICAADRRYYNFERPIEIMRRKVPIALIHEASGIVYYDAKGEYRPGEAVVLIPTLPNIESAECGIKENYRSDSEFCSSSVDGFMQSIVPIRRDRLIKIDREFLRVSVFCELLSVAVGAAKSLDAEKIGGDAAIGVWGDWPVGYIMALALRYFFPELRILIFGLVEAKLAFFSFAENAGRYADKTVLHDSLDAAFECVGGNAVGDILDEIISLIKPQGIINLIGVSEYKQNVNTRMLLEKGLTLRGHSRSDRDSFIVATQMINDNKWIRDSLLSIISEEIEINSTAKIHSAFERDTYNDFKTILRWQV